MALDLAGVCCSTGSACASGSSEPSPTLVAMGCPSAILDSSLRFSLGSRPRAAEMAEATGSHLEDLQRVAGRENWGKNPLERSPGGVNFGKLTACFCRSIPRWKQAPDRARRHLISPLAEGAFALSIWPVDAGWASGSWPGRKTLALGVVSVLDDLFAAAGSRTTRSFCMVLPGSANRTWPHGLAHRGTFARVARAVIGLRAARTLPARYAEAVEARGVPAWRRRAARRTFSCSTIWTSWPAKPAAQIELLHTIDALLQTACQVVVTAPPPAEPDPASVSLLVSRLAAGLIVASCCPGRALRLAILRDVMLRDDC